MVHNFLLLSLYNRCPVQIRDTFNLHFSGEVVRGIKVKGVLYFFEIQKTHKGKFFVRKRYTICCANKIT